MRWPRQRWLSWRLAGKRSTSAGRAIPAALAGGSCVLEPCRPRTPLRTQPAGGRRMVRFAQCVRCERYAVALSANMARSQKVISCIAGRTAMNDGHEMVTERFEDINEKRTRGSKPRILFVFLWRARKDSLVRSQDKPSGRKEPCMVCNGINRGSAFCIILKKR